MTTTKKKVEALDPRLVTNQADTVKADALALLEAAGGALPATEIAERTGHSLRDTVNALCDGALFRRVSRGVYTAEVES